ncbi:MAG TPA: TolC family protein [Bryobacteraceae bacterium]|nr:TolC family protein [Bryobacteraceae bacterium]
MRLVSLWLAAVPLLAQDAAQRAPLQLSLKRAVEIATSPEGSAQVQLSTESWKQARARSAEARAALLPDVEASFNDRNQTTNLAALGITSIHVPVPGFEFPSLVGPYSTADARASVNQSVFDFSTIRRYQGSRAGVSAAKSDVDASEEQVAGQVARTYLAAIKADADVETAKANVTLSQAVLTQAENQKKAGTGTGIEVTRAKVQLSNDQQRLLVAQNDRRRSYLQLLRAMGLRLDTEVQLMDALHYEPIDAGTLAEARAKALKERPDYRAQREREANARLDASATKMERLPSLAAFGDYGSIGTSLNNALPTRTYGISLRVPVFDGGRRDARRAETASQYRAETVRTNDLKEQIELDVRLALDSLQSADDQVKVAKEGLELSENELAQARRRYEAGVANSLEVTDAQTRLERARDNQTAALYNYNAARIDLSQALGTIRKSIQ